MLFRRTLPAMATTLTVFIGARLAFVSWVRPHLLAPLHQTFALTTSSVNGFGMQDGGAPQLFLSPSILADAWVYSTQIVDKAGHALTPEFLANACQALMNQTDPKSGDSGRPIPAPPAVEQAFETCVAKVGAVYHGVVTYQPSSRYWAFQWYETAIFIALALVLAGFCFWWSGRRLG